MSRTARQLSGSILLRPSSSQSLFVIFKFENIIALSISLVKPFRQFFHNLPKICDISTKIKKNPLVCPTSHQSPLQTNFGRDITNPGRPSKSVGVNFCFLRINFCLNGSPRTSTPTMGMRVAEDVDPYNGDASLRGRRPLQWGCRSPRTSTPTMGADFYVMQGYSKPICPMSFLLNSSTVL